MTDSNFIITIFGNVQSPTLYIGDHEYTVNVNVDTGEHLTIDSGEHLTIDSIEKTITLVKSNGEQVNCFNNRNKDSYVFKKIPVGTSQITSTGQIYFSITLLEERSEPKWI